MAFCPGCGQDYEGTKFCSGCGMNLEAAEAALASRCPQCDAELDEGARFCSGCGFQIQDAVMSPAATATGQSDYTGKRGDRAPLSVVGRKTDSGLKCPKCGGTQFKAKRSVAGKMAVGVLAPKTQVKCETCGTMFKRG
jgi:DNA-directed RNA polymerase subunit RPC12/RpoP